MINNMAEINLMSIDGGGRLITPRLPTVADPHNSLYNDYILNGIDIDGGYVPWHPVVEARAYFVHDFIATKFSSAFLWREGGPTGECLVVPCVPDEFCAPCVPDELTVPAGGKQC